MNDKFYQVLPCSILLLSAVSAHAAMDMDSRITQLEKQMKEVRVENAMGTFGATTATARPEVGGHGWYLMLGPIYERPCVGGTEFTYTDDDPTASLAIRGRTRNVDFNWEWGIRAGVGYYFEHDAWDIGLGYTWLSADGSRSVNAGLNSSTIPLKGSATLVQNCSAFGANTLFAFDTNAKSQFGFDYHNLALELGRNYFISQMLSLRPHFGLKSAWLFLDQVTRFSGGNIISGSDSGLGTNTVDIKDESDFWGLGPRAGFDTNWYLGCGFSIFGNVSGSLLFGRFDVDHREKFSLCSQINRINVNANEHRFVPATDLQLGLAYGRFFDNDRQHIDIRIGYEVTYYWRANQMLKTDDLNIAKYGRYAEDVGIYGLMIDAKWSF